LGHVVTAANFVFFFVFLFLGRGGGGDVDAGSRKKDVEEPEGGNG
jgi:hypothetical protein